MSKTKTATIPTDKAAPTLPNLDEIKSIPVGIVKFVGSQDGKGMIQKSSLTSRDHRNDRGDLVPNRSHTIAFVPSLDCLRIKYHGQKGTEAFMIPLSRVAYWVALSE